MFLVSAFQTMAWKRAGQTVRQAKYGQQNQPDSLVYILSMAAFTTKAVLNSLTELAYDLFFHQM